MSFRKIVRSVSKEGRSFSKGVRHNNIYAHCSYSFHNTEADQFADDVVQVLCNLQYSAAGLFRFNLRLEKMLLFVLVTLPFITGLNSPDGLSAGGGGICICEENAGRVLYAAFDGTVTVIAEELSSPEGICVTESGRIFVVEDAEHGRLVELMDDSVVTLVSDLCCPEGVAVDESGDIWFTTGGIQGGCLFTSLWKMSEAEVSVEYSLPSAFSFSDVEAVDDGMIYVCSESSGLFGSVAVFRFNPASGELLPFVTGVSACEGICTTAGGFPLYITDEGGSVYTVDTDGTPVLFQDGLETVEDVVVVNGRLFVSEDGTGSILVLEPHE